MGFGKTLGKYVGGSTDEAASASDDYVDESMDEAYARRDGASGNDDYVDQNVNQQGDTQSTWGTVTDAGKRGISGAGSELKSTVSSGLTKTAIVGGGLYTGLEAMDMQAAKDQRKKAQAAAKQAQSKQNAYDQMLARIEEIRNNDNLSAEEKKAAIAETRAVFRDTWGIDQNNTNSGGSIPGLNGLLSILGLGGGGGGAGSGIVGKFFIGLLGISAIWILPSLIEAVKGRA